MKHLLFHPSDFSHLFISTWSLSPGLCIRWEAIALRLEAIAIRLNALLGMGRHAKRFLEEPTLAITP